MEPITKDELKKLHFKQSIKYITKTIINEVIGIAETERYSTNDLRYRPYLHNISNYNKDIEFIKSNKKVNKESITETLINKVTNAKTRVKEYEEMIKATSYFHSNDKIQICNEVIKHLRSKFPDSIVEYRIVEFAEGYISGGIYVDWS